MRNYFKRRSLRSKPFDRNIIVIGAGSGGLVSAYISALLGAHVTLIEKHKMGGDCLNTGCVPSKALLNIAHQIQSLEGAPRLGIDVTVNSINFSDVMRQVQESIEAIAPHDSVERYQELGVECIQGEAKFVTPWVIEVNGRLYSSRNIILATGATPFVPPIEGLSDSFLLTSDTIWKLQQRPEKLLILGGGAIGCEMAECFATLGSQVTLVDLSEQLLPAEDPDAAKIIKEKLESLGVTFLLNSEVYRFDSSKKAHHNKVETIARIRPKNSTKKEGNISDDDSSIVFDKVLVAIGRSPSTKGLGLELIDLKRDARGAIITNSKLQTNYPHIFAVGDVTGRYQLTHSASHQAGYAIFNAMFGWLHKLKVDFSIMPSVIYTSPQIGRVGINEKQANAQNIKYDLCEYHLDDLDRAIIDRKTAGFIKVLTVPNKDKILGVTIVGAHAEHLLAEFTLAMKHNIGLNKILNTIHAYPTTSEAVKYVAGVWKKKHSSPFLLSLAKRYNNFLKG